jgi:V8-like Glu-specific endopeptidase
MVLFWVICFVAFSSKINRRLLQDLPDDDKIVYGPDDRLDYYDRVNQFGENDAFARIGRESIVALMRNVGSPNANGVYLSGLENRGNNLRLCSGERFRDQATAASCSGTLVSPNQVITAGHCITSQSACRSIKFVFNFYVTSYRNGQPQYAEIRDDDIYSCTSVVTRNSNGDDWAVATLDRAVPASSGHVPIPFLSSANQALPTGQELVMIGFPSGLPMKIEDGGTVIQPNAGHLRHFGATTDAFAGNSGSGVFTKDLNNPVMVGILVRGQTDYISRGSCREVNQVCDGGACGTEGVSYVFHAAAHVNRDGSGTQGPEPTQGPETTQPSGASLQCGQTVQGSTVGRASTLGNAAGDMIYTFNAGQATEAVFDLCMADYDSYLRIYDASGSEIARNDDHGGACGGSNRYSSHVSTAVTPGQDYRVLVEGYSSASGSFTLEVRCNEPDTPTESDYFTMTGDCDVQDDCVSSANYPGAHGNRESCSVTMLRNAALTVSSTFSLETCCDHLMIRGVDTERSSAVPASLNSGETFTWTTDSSVTRAGWQICFSETAQTTAVETTTTPSPSLDPTSDPTISLTDEPTNSPTVYPTSDPTSDPTVQDTCGDKVCDFGEMTSCPDDCETELIEAICDCAKVAEICDGTCADVGILDPLLFPECNTYAAAGICGGVVPMEMRYTDMCPDQCSADETTEGPTTEAICGDKVCDFGEMTSCPEDCEVELMDAICDCAKVADICDGTCADVGSLDPVLFPECSTYATAGICGAVVPMEMSYMDMCPDQCSDETTWKPDWSTEEPTEEDTCGNKLCDFEEMTSCPEDCEAELIEAICDCVKVAEICDGTCADVGSLDPVQYPECSTYAAAGICGGVIPMEMSYRDMCASQCPTDEPTLTPTMSPTMNPTSTPTPEPTILPTEDPNGGGLVPPAGCSCVRTEHPTWGVIDSCTVPAGTNFSPFCYVSGSCASQPSSSVPGSRWADCVQNDGSSGLSLQCGSSVSGSTRGRASQVGHTSGDYSYEFTAQSSTSVTFDLCDSEFDTYLRIFQGSGNEIARNDDHGGRCGSGNNRLASHVETTVQAGLTYTVVVEGYRSSEGNFQLDVTCADGGNGGGNGGDNDNTIACGRTVSGTTVGRSSIVGNNAGEAMFQFVATESVYEFDACLSTYDSVIRVYEGAAASLTRTSRQIAMNDDHGGRCSGSNRFASHINRARTTIGQTYTLVVEGYNSNEGNFVVTANCD